MSNPGSSSAFPLVLLAFRTLAAVPPLQLGAYLACGTCRGIAAFFVAPLLLPAFATPTPTPTADADTEEGGRLCACAVADTIAARVLITGAVDILALMEEEEDDDEEEDEDEDDEEEDDEEDEDEAVVDGL